MFRLTIWRIILSYMASPKFMTQLGSSSRFSPRYLLGLLPRFRGNGLKSHSSGEDITLPTGESYWLVPPAHSRRDGCSGGQWDACPNCWCASHGIQCPTPSVVGPCMPRIPALIRRDIFIRSMNASNFSRIVPLPMANSVGTDVCFDGRT